MSNDWFFEKFALIADAPGAVATMRGLVLDLAVRGKLVRQKQQDESATILLERIHSSSSQTPTRRSIRRQDTQADIEPPYPLPINWTWTTLGTIADWGSGSTPSRGNPEFFGGNTTWLKSGELNDNRALVGSEEQVTELAIKKGSFRLNKPGDVLFAMYGATVGKAAILAEPALTNQAVCGCTPCLGVLNDYLFFYLVSQRQKFRNASEGGAQPNFSKDKIVTFPFPLPPLAEQKRIVAKVDELMGLCDALESQQQERELRKSVLVRSSLSRFAESPTPENLGYLFHKSYDIPPSELRKSILTLAVQGKLVPQDPNDEPAAEIKMQIAKRMSAIRNQRHHTFAATEDQTDPPFPIPHNWVWMTFGTLGEFLGGGTPSKDNPAYWNGEIPWVSPKDMKRPYICDSIDHVTPLGADASSGRLIPTGALLMVVRGMILAHTFPVAITTREVTINQDMKALRLTVHEIGEYLLRCCTALTGAMLSNVERSSHGTCRIPTEALSSFLVPIPPLAEQRRIVAKVDQLMSLVDELERQQEASREKATKLLDAIVHEMTSGGRNIAATLES